MTKNFNNQSNNIKIKSQILKTSHCSSVNKDNLSHYLQIDQRNHIHQQKIEIYFNNRRKDVRKKSLYLRINQKDLNHNRPNNCLNHNQ